MVFVISVDVKGALRLVKSVLEREGSFSFCRNSCIFSVDDCGVELSVSRLYSAP